MKLIELKGEIDKSMITVGDFKTILSIIVIKKWAKIQQGFRRT